MKRHRSRFQELAGLGLTIGIVGLAALGSATGARNRKKTPGGSDNAPGRTARTSGKSFGKYKVVGRTVTIARPRQELYDFWREFGNLPQFMENVESVRTTGTDGRAIWTIKAPGGRSVEIETGIAREQPGELIAWRSIEGSDVDTEGRVTFRDAPGERGTRVEAIIAYKPPGGELGRMLAHLFLREPEVQARHDLKRFKMLMETGEIATSARRKDEARWAKMQENA